MSLTGYVQYHPIFQTSPKSPGRYLTNSELIKKIALASDTALAWHASYLGGYLPCYWYCDIYHPRE